MSAGLSKSNFLKLKKQIKVFEKTLPALNLKKQQIYFKIASIQKQQEELKENIEKLFESIKTKIPMIATTKLKLNNLIKIEKVETQTINLLGIRVPSFKAVHIKKVSTGFSTLPFWIHFYFEKMEEYFNLKSRIEILNMQKKSLQKEAIKTSQKVNLFENVLLPKKYNTIKKIKIFLEDNERASVVRCKIMKSKVIQ